MCIIFLCTQEYELCAQGCLPSGDLGPGVLMHKTACPRVPFGLGTFSLRMRTFKMCTIFSCTQEHELCAQRCGDLSPRVLVHRTACPQMSLGLGAFSLRMRALKCVLYSAALNSMRYMLGDACPQENSAPESSCTNLPALKCPSDWGPLASG
jgi:hypothetical protein